MNRPIFENPQLDGSSFFLENTNSTAAVLLFHGFTSTTVEVRPLAEYLHNSGYVVSAPLLPGHGTAPEDMLSVRYPDWLDTAERAYQQLAAFHVSIIVGGESMGALLALHLAAQHPNIAGAVVFAPAIHIPGQWRAPLLAPFIKFQPKYYLSDEEKPAQPDVLPWQGYNVLPIPAVAQFYRLQLRIKRQLSAVCQPALIFQGKLDGTIDPAGAQTVLASIGSRDRQLVWLERSGHTLLLGLEHQAVFAQTLQFIQRVTNPAVAGFQ